MTFWQDARPASPRFRLPRVRRRIRRWLRRRRRVGLVLAAVLLASAGISLVRAGGENTAKANAAPTPSTKPGHVPPRWSRTVPDWVQSMVADHGDVIVIGDNWVSSVALDDGRLWWQREVPHLDDGGVVRGDTILVSTEIGFAALDRGTGKVRWFTETPETPDRVALIGPDAAHQIAMVTTAEGGLVGLDARTGRARWSTRLTGHLRGFPSVDQRSGTVAMVWQDDATSSELRVVDSATGAVRWVQDLGVMAGSPIVAHGTVAVSAGNGSKDSAVQAFALTDGGLRWRSPVAAPSQSDLRPLLDGDDLYVVDQVGNVARIRFSDGERRWSTDTKALVTHAHPIRVDGAVLVWNERGEVVTLDRDTGAIRARRVPAGLPVGLAATGRLVVVAQRLVRDHALQAFSAARLAGPARSRR
jgi:outer membrane protein assembly factor BamB